MRNEHKAAWLVEQAVAGTIELTGSDTWDAKDMALVRLAPGDAGAQRLLDTAFRGRQLIVLGRYDQDFVGPPTSARRSRAGSSSPAPG